MSARANENGGRPGYPWSTAQNIAIATAICARHPMTWEAIARTYDVGLDYETAQRAAAGSVQLAGFFALLSLTDPLTDPTRS